MTSDNPIKIEYQSIGFTVIKQYDTSINNLTTLKVTMYVDWLQHSF